MFKNELYIYGKEDVIVPAHLNFGKYMLDKFRRHQEGMALENAVTGETLTYKELTRYAVSLYISLIRLGVKKGDIVAVGCEKRIDFIPTVLAIIFTGATYTPYDVYSGRAVLKHKLSITYPKYFILSNKFWDTHKDILQSFDCIKTFISLDEGLSDAVPVKDLITDRVDITKFEPVEVVGQTDTAFILYSSRTTGMPKGVELTHLNCILNSAQDEFKDESLQTAFVCGVWYHNYDTFMTYKFLAAGRKVVYAVDFSEENVLMGMDKCQINIGMLSPSFVSYLSKREDLEKYNFNSIKIIYSRSGPLHATTIENFKKRFPDIKVLQGYGMTEAGELTSESWATKETKAGSVGKPSPCIVLKIADLETRKTLGPKQPGEICVKGPILMKGYIGIDSSSYLDEEGFLKTGDLGYYDDDEYFYIIDRIKEIINYKGCKIAPLELETILMSHPDVCDAAVVGKPIPDCGEVPAAFIMKQQSSNITETDLINYVASEVSPLMQLRGGVRFIDKIPRNPRGKILRRRLREMLNDEDN
ncbi:unnamed protein product [Parnassius apollo]|uniref:(apollo) hypothetical protein n=1 Tax=Parnassius apollo TaxID=110799 RepID=A0A8S3WPP4_PARAO|nr:unnamed protein product [Parnassius apollo]